MRYLILKPSTPSIDPRSLKLPDMAALHDLIPLVSECSSEEEAARCVRNMLPDAASMIVPVVIGVGQTFLLGMLEDGSAKIDPDRPMPFALVVQAVAESDADRWAMKKAIQRNEPPFREELWKLRPVIPMLFKTESVELRASDLRVPAYVDAKIGAHNGRLTIYVELGGIEMSLTFKNPALELVERDDLEAVIGKPNVLALLGQT